MTGIDALFRGGVPVAIVHWRSGVAPCTVYHHAATETTSTRTTLIRIFERLDASLSCPDRVEDKSTEVRLTSLRPGTHTLVGGASRPTVTTTITIP